MRAVLWFVGTALGSLAFQLSVLIWPDKFKHYAWAVKWLWVGWFVCLLIWLLTHEKLLGGKLRNWWMSVTRTHTSVAPATVPKLEGEIDWSTARMYPAELLRTTTDGPDIGIEYSYSDNEREKMSDPLVAVNISTKDAARNVRFLPFTVGGLTASFSPDIIPFIGPGGKVEVKPIIDGVFPTLRHDFPALFRRSYKDESTEELFGRHMHHLHIEYEDSAHEKLFETTALIRYRPWKTEITVGETRRRIKEIL
jgi:hypothetical protein